MSDLDYFEREVRHFMDKFELVFGNDWEMTRQCISDGDYISKSGSFLEPMVEDESNNWANRGSLLDAYRDLCDLLELMDKKKKK